MMTRRERLLATLRGEAVDRPAVNFYEVGGFDVKPDDPDPFNVYNAPDWRPLLQLAEDQTDLIRMRCPVLRPAADNPRDAFFQTETRVEGGSRFVQTTLRVGGRTLSGLTRRDRDVDTVWTLEHLLKDLDDLHAYLQLPAEVFHYEPELAHLEEAERAVGDRGIVMVDVADPLCHAAQLFSMADYTVIALLEPVLFHQLLAKLAADIHARTEKVARAFPGRLWRIYGPEYAAEPYLPPSLFEQYVGTYTRPMVDAIQRYGGFARIHCHGRLRAVIGHIVAMGGAGLDPIEPPPAGDMELAEVRRRYGRELVLFGNLEARDIENLPPAEFARKVAQSVREGTAGAGRGFVLMPSASPYGRTISANTLKNYELMVTLAQSFGG